CTVFGCASRGSRTSTVVFGELLISLVVLTLTEGEQMKLMHEFRGPESLSRKLEVGYPGSFQVLLVMTVLCLADGDVTSMSILGFLLHPLWYIKRQPFYGDKGRLLRLTECSTASCKHFQRLLRSQARRIQSGTKVDVGKVQGISSRVTRYFNEQDFSDRVHLLRDTDDVTSSRGLMDDSSGANWTNAPSDWRPVEFSESAIQNEFSLQSVEDTRKSTYL
ncbi:hypothetical protein CLF_112875, partial [Clonorchis sinensis]